MMTKEEISKHIVEKMDHEIKGCSEYLDMCEKAQEMENYELAHGLSEMAKDEYTHAHFMFEYMAENNIDVPETSRHDFYALQKRIMAFPTAE